MTDKELEQKSDDLMRLFFSFCDDAELDKYIDEEERIEAIEELIEEVGEDNFEMGVTFIRENYWEQYCEDTAYDFGFLDRQDDNNPLHYHIDWQGWANAVAMDYNQTEFDGDNHYWRV